MSIKRKLTAVVLAVNLVTLGSVQTFAHNKDRGLNVMTYNMYLGSDFTDIFQAQTGQEVLLEVGEAYRDMLAGNVPERVAAIADQIEAGEPVLVGLQEVALWKTGPFLNEDPAADVTYDFLQLLLDELAARGLNYAPIVVQTNLDVELPGIVTPTDFRDIRYTDRDVILARSDLRTSQLKIEGTQSGTFAARIPVTVLGQTITVVRGWASADVKFRGKTYRFLNAHLESIVEAIQVLQASELLAGPANTDLPLILVGDFNSDAEASGTAYLMLIGAGLTDIWDDLQPSDPGYTWPLSGEIPLPTEQPTQRLDLVLVRGKISLASADIHGESVADLTPSGFRPSDHAGVGAAVILQP
jgi:endonuclease/exonuclease/phosphatase family metal-dependent hydrolase